LRAIIICLSRSVTSLAPTVQVAVNISTNAKSLSLSAKTVPMIITSLIQQSKY